MLTCPVQTLLDVAWGEWNANCWSSCHQVKTVQTVSVVCVKTRTFVAFWKSLRNEVALWKQYVWLKDRYNDLECPMLPLHDHHRVDAEHFLTFGNHSTSWRQHSVTHQGVPPHSFETTLPQACQCRHALNVLCSAF